MKMIKVGDRVMVLDDNIEGRVTLIDGVNITVLSDDGFELIFAPNELLVVETNEMQNLSFNKKQVLSEKNSNPPKKKASVFITKERPAPEFDLHIEKLTDAHKSMTKHDKLTYQLDTAKRHIEFAIKNRIPKIILIHGVGEGVLKTELEYLLNRYDQLYYREANYSRYGAGATEVLLKQSTK